MRRHRRRHHHRGLCFLSPRHQVPHNIQRVALHVQPPDGVALERVDVLCRTGQVIGAGGVRLMACGASRQHLETRRCDPLGLRDWPVGGHRRHPTCGSKSARSKPLPPFPHFSSPARRTFDGNDHEKSLGYVWVTANRAFLCRLVPEGASATLMPSQSRRGLAPFVSSCQTLKIPVSAVRFRPRHHCTRRLGPPLAVGFVFLSFSCSTWRAELLIRHPTVCGPRAKISLSSIRRAGHDLPEIRFPPVPGRARDA